MEFEYSRNSRRSKLYISVGIVVALVVAGVVFAVIKQASEGAAAAVTTRQIVVAVRDIPGRKPIEEGDVAVRAVPADATNATAYARIDQVLSHVSAVTISAGQFITPNMLASAVSGQAFSILEPGSSFDPKGPDWRAVSVSVADDRAVAGLLQPGQRVDLVVTMAINPAAGTTPEPSASATEAAVPGPSTKVTLQSLMILARNGAMYILRTDLATAEQIAELQAAGGQFALVLRPEEDSRTATTEGSTIDMLQKEFNFPIPRPLDLGAVSPSPSPTTAP